MAKPGLTLATATKAIAERCSTSGWSLCIGAGTSRPLFPDWRELVEKLVSRDPSVGNAANLTATLLKQFSPDSLIEASRNRLNMPEEAFSKALSDELYRRAQTTLTPPEFTALTTMLAGPKWSQISKATWNAFNKVLEARFAGTSAFAMAEVVAEVMETELAPSRILSFNAEPLFL